MWIEGARCRCRLLDCLHSNAVAPSRSDAPQPPLIALLWCSLFCLHRPPVPLHGWYLLSPDTKHEARAQYCSFNYWFPKIKKTYRFPGSSKEKYWFPFSEISLAARIVRELEGNSEAPALQVWSISSASGSLQFVQIFVGTVGIIADGRAQATPPVYYLW